MSTTSSCLRGPRQFQGVSEVPQEVELKGRLGKGATGWVDRKLVKWQGDTRDVAARVSDLTICIDLLSWPCASTRVGWRR